MSDILITKLKQIEAEKSLKLIPENIKKDVTVFGITGELEAGTSSEVILPNRISFSNASWETLPTWLIEADWSEIKTASNMFQSNQNLITVAFPDSFKPTSSQEMFYQDTKLTSVTNLDISKNNNLNSMFYGCTSIVDCSFMKTWKYAEKSMAASGMMQRCSNLVDISNFPFNKMSNLSYCFMGCTKLSTVPEFEFNTTISTSGVSSMFSNCSSLSDNSLNNILLALSKIQLLPSTTLKDVGLSLDQCYKCVELSNYSTYKNAGGLTGYPVIDDAGEPDAGLIGESVSVRFSESLLKKLAKEDEEYPEYDAFIRFFQAQIACYSLFTDNSELEGTSPSTLWEYGPYYSVSPEIQLSHGSDISMIEETFSELVSQNLFTDVSYNDIKSMVYVSFYLGHDWDEGSPEYATNFYKYKIILTDVDNKIITLDVADQQNGE